MKYELSPTQGGRVKNHSIRVPPNLRVVKTAAKKASKTLTYFYHRWNHPAIPRKKIGPPAKGGPGTKSKTERFSSPAILLVSRYTG